MTKPGAFPGRPHIRQHGGSSRNGRNYVVSCNMTNINTRDGLENLRAVLERLRSCFRNDKKPEKDPKGSTTTGG